MMLTVNRTWTAATLLALALLAPGTIARAGEKDSNTGSGAAPAPTIEEQLRQQAAMLRQMHDLLLKQQAEIDRLRTELDAVRAGAAPTGATPASATPAVADASVADAAPAQTAPVAAPAPDDALAKKVESLDKAWGKLRLTGDVRFRYEGFYNQGFDAANDVDSRNRMRIRVRTQLAGRIDNHFDWAIRIASGGFNDPTSNNATLTDYYNRKPFAIDRAFLHFQTDTKPGNLEVYAGKFDYTWKRTTLTFDSDLQPEGLSERLRMDLANDSPLKRVTLTAWQLPFRERSVGADAFILGGQVLTDWKWSDNWTSSLSGSFHDFEQVDLIPPATGVSPVLVNAGFEIGTTNTVFVNPFTNLPEYRSEFRVFDIIGDVTYRGFGDRYPVTLIAEWLHNTSAFNNQRDGGFASVQFGRRSEQDDFYLDYAFFKNEREVFPSVFVESDVLQTNSVAHWITGAYMIRKNVEVATRYFLQRRLQTVSPENRWLNRFQLDMIYSF
jgi:hypothetical protein